MFNLKRKLIEFAIPNLSLIICFCNLYVRNFQNEHLEPMQNISWYCVWVLWIHKGNFLTKEMVSNVGFKAFWFSKLLWFELPHCLIIWFSGLLNFCQNYLISFFRIRFNGLRFVRNLFLNLQVYYMSTKTKSNLIFCNHMLLSLSILKSTFPTPSTFPS